MNVPHRIPLRARTEPVHSPGTVASVFRTAANGSATAGRRARR
ncbi:hypothetical protein ACFPN7_26260 [Amycolatopsis halotolerans]